MNSINRMKLELSRSIQNLSSCIYHFNEIDNIYNNTYIMTIHFRDKNNIDYKCISKDVHKAINKAIVNKEKPRNNKNAGLLMNFDIEGTREYKPVIDKYICPHVHGCILLQKSTIKNRSDEEIITSIEKQIFKDNSYLKSQVQKIWIKKLDANNGNLLSYITYSSKAENFEGITSKINQTTFIYPYENKAEKVNFISEELHINEKQQVKEMQKIGDRIEEIANLIATKPIEIFGDIGGEKAITDYKNLYEKNYNRKIVSDDVELFSFINNLIKPDPVRLN